MTRRALLADAFTQEPFAGNGAGVVPGARDLSDSRMEASASELGATETAFVRASDAADRRLRYFTPTEEVDLCGHATIATHAFLADDIGEGTHTLETNVGVLDIELDGETVWMRQNAPEVAKVDATRAEVAETLGIRDHVEMHTDVPEDQLAALYRNAQLFVLSSNEEGLGLVLAEAMASGTPVVSTDCGGPSTLIEDGQTGFLVPTGDAEALADRMAHVLTHPEKAWTLGQAGRERVEAEFSVEAAGERFLQVYDELVTDQSPTQ